MLEVVHDAYVFCDNHTASGSLLDEIVRQRVACSFAKYVAIVGL